MSNRLTALPAEIVALTNLRELDLEHNSLTALPDTFFELLEGCDVDLRDNNFTEQQISLIRERVGDRFRVHVSIREVDESLLPSLEIALACLKEESGREIPLWSNITDHDRGRLKAFFSYLGYSIAWKREGLRKAIAIFLVDCFDYAKEDRGFRGVFLSLLDDAAGTCGDRVSLYLNQIFLQYHLHKGTLPEGFTLPEFFVGQRRLELLFHAATEFVRNYRGVVDEIEVYLALQVQLCEQLHLPILTKEMLYFSCSALRDDGLEVIGKIVLEQTADLRATLLESEAWQQYLMTRYAKDEYKELNITECENPQEVQSRFVREQTNKLIPRGSKRKWAATFPNEK